MTTSRVFDPVSGLTFDIANYDGPIGPPIEIIGPSWLGTDNSPRCDCGHLFEICDHPRCPLGDQS